MGLWNGVAGLAGAFFHQVLAYTVGDVCFCDGARSLAKLFGERFGGGGRGLGSEAILWCLMGFGGI